MKPPLIRLTQVKKNYSTPAGEFTALKDISLDFHPGEYVGIFGKSGSGKSTLLNMIAGLDRPSQGRVEVEGQNLGELSETQIARLRGRKIGVVFQFFQLLPTLSVLENIMLPMDFTGTLRPKEREARAFHWLEKTGVADQAHKLPSSLSGGQQQRVAISRALANDPALLVADEPTGNLDSKSAEGIYRIFSDLVTQGKTLVLVSHDSSLASVVDRTIQIHDGLVLQDTPVRLQVPHREVLHV